MPATSIVDSAAWYDNESALVQAIARSVAGYKGKLAEHCHVIPRGMVKYGIEHDTLANLEPDESDYPVQVDSMCGFVTRISDDVFRARVHQLCQVVIEGSGGEDAVYLLEPTFYHMEVVVEDGAGARFVFDVLLNLCSNDGGKNPAACVWDHNTSHLIAYWPGSYLAYDITWLDKELADRFVPHPTTVIPVDTVYDADDDAITPFASLCTKCPITCSLSDGKNQLELMLTTVINLAIDERYFPQVVPEAVLQKARAVYFKSVYGQDGFATQLVSEYLDFDLYLDDEAEKY
ncbi:Aste57867_21237 [Aphanomyces stellatus]|uniref:Aste57867_21237 protein n=1 Tax=Aphanomyces stellatus TaxID=120398 RepID=A0A485LGZ5_9STRA|nr:hypothetical protein As57867_021169 [Aphanomyces stellatus]VFT97909.1 Aste57867_21237 [Aphanomyces stellatus]